MNNIVVYLNIIISLLIKALIPDGRYGVVTIITDVVILPFTLAIFNIFLFVNKLETSLIKLWVLMLFSLILGDLLGYFIWGITNKCLLNPDGETIWIKTSLFIYHIIFVIILFTIIKMIYYFTNLKR